MAETSVPITDHTPARQLPGWPPKLAPSPGSRRSRPLAESGRRPLLRPAVD